MRVDQSSVKFLNVARGLWLMALPSHQCRLGARYFTLSMIVAVAIALFVYQWLPAPPPASAAPLAAIPALVFSSEEIPDSIALGESFDLEFQIGLMSGTGGHGGISVSFPDLTARGGVRHPMTPIVKR